MIEGKLERVYLAITGDSCSIYHRPTYQYIKSCKTCDAGTELKKLLQMTTKEFYSMLLNDMPYFRIDKPTLTNDQNKNQEEERWYTGAWKFGTDKVLEENNLTMIYEEIPWDYIEDIQHSKHSGWGLGNKGSFSHDDILDKLTSGDSKRKKKKKIRRKEAREAHTHDDTVRHTKVIKKDKPYSVNDSKHNKSIKRIKRKGTR